MRKIKIISMFATVLVGVVFLISPVRAEDSVLVATVNIPDAKIAKQENNKIWVYFEINNREKVQPDVRYAVNLVRKDGEKQTVVDQKVYSDVLTLKAGESAKKVVEYQAPQYFAGKYMIVLESRTSDGLILASRQAAEITLSGDNGYVDIDEASCYLMIAGDGQKTKYTLGQGVDIAKNETLLANCEAQNNFKNRVTVTPVFETRVRSVFGKSILTEKKNTISFEAGQKQMMVLEIPKVAVPQAYDSILTFQDGQGNVVSDMADFHFVLRGASATIQNVRLDKESYQAGETANLAFLWSGSADSFEGSRLGKTDIGEINIKIEMRDGQGRLCAEPVSAKSGNNGSQGEYSIKITSDCRNPWVFADVADSDGKVLMKKNFDFSDADKRDAEISGQYPGSAGIPMKTTAVLIILILLLISVIALIIKRRKSVGVIVALVVASGTLSLNVLTVSADTFSTPGVNISYTLDNLLYSSYCANQAISLTGKSNNSGCGNYSNVSTMTVSMGGSSVSGSVQDGNTGFNLGYINPGLPGFHQATINVNNGAQQWSGYYSVTGPSNGACVAAPPTKAVFDQKFYDGTKDCLFSWDMCTKYETKETTVCEPINSDTSGIFGYGGGNPSADPGCYYDENSGYCANLDSTYYNIWNNWSGYLNNGTWGLSTCNKVKSDGCTCGTSAVVKTADECVKVEKQCLAYGGTVYRDPVTKADLNGELCAAGSYASLSADGTWQCKGSCGGGIASCSVATPPSVVSACVGDIPANATVCPNAESGITSETSRKLVAACTGAKCEYTCGPNYNLSPDSCNLSGSGKYNGCPGDGLGLTKLVGTGNQMEIYSHSSTNCSASVSSTKVGSINFPVGTNITGIGSYNSCTGDGLGITKLVGSGSKIDVYGNVPGNCGSVHSQNGSINLPSGITASGTIIYNGCPGDGMGLTELIGSGNMITGTTVSSSNCNNPNTDAGSITISGCQKCVFNGTNYILNVNKSTGGNVSSMPVGIYCGSSGNDCEESYISGTSVALTATPESGFQVSAWSGCDSSSGGTCIVTMNSAKNVNVTFGTTCAQACVDTPTQCTESCGGGTQTCTWKNSDCSESTVTLSCNMQSCPAQNNLNWKEVSPN